jgi:hypothetical protein
MPVYTDTDSKTVTSKSISTTLSDTSIDNNLPTVGTVNMNTIVTYTGTPVTVHYPLATPVEEDWPDTTYNTSVYIPQNQSAQNN